MITLGKSIRTILITASIAFMTGCGGGGGGGGNVQPTPPVQEDVITWTNGVYGTWVRTSQGVTSSTNCTVDVYSRSVWWEKNVNGVKTGIKGGLIRTDTENRNEQCTSSISSSPTVVSTSDAETSSSSTSNGTAVTNTTNVTEDRTSTDSNGSTVTKTYKVYTDTTTTPLTTTTTVTTTRTTTYSDDSTTNEVVSTSTSSNVANSVTTATREELTNTVVTANVKSTSDSDSTSTSTANGTAVTNTTNVTEDRTSTDANGSTVTKTYKVYTDTTSTPVTTTSVVTTTRTTLWTDNTTTTAVINTSTSDSVANSVTTATREELTNTVVTANVVSTETIYKNESTSQTEGALTSEFNSAGVDSNTTLPDGSYGMMTTTYFKWYKNTYTTTEKDEYTKTTYTDGTVTEALVGTVTTNSSPTKVYLYKTFADGSQELSMTAIKTNSNVPFIGNPTAPTDSSSNGSYTHIIRNPNHNKTNYDASAYYNDANLGTATVGVNNDPASYNTSEAENGSTLVTYANHAYARGWTGKGSTALIMDTGIDQDHSEFAGKIKYKWDAGYNTPYEDENGHGTHVAGIVSANKDGTGIHGVAYDTQLAIAKIGEANGISLSAAKQALNWAKQYDDIVVANLSANTNYSSSYKSAMTDNGNGVFTNNHAVYGGSNYYNLETVSSWKDVIPAELVLVVSAGNTDAGYVQNPATMATAVDASGNLELDGRMLVAGNWNTSTQTIDGAKSGHVCKDYTAQCNDAYKTSDFYILAPGTNIKSTQNGGGYTNMSGTSQAAPAVTAGVSIVHQMWPYMKGKNIAQVLLQTANKNLTNYSVTTHGQGLMDLDKATQPIGSLSISTTGRTGNSASISGSISADGVDADVSSVSAIDDFDRDFNVDLSSMVNNTVGSIEQLRHKRGQSWAVKQANISTSDYMNFTVGTDNEDTYVLGYTHNLNNDLDLNVTYSKTKDSPWLSMYGVWGDVTGATTIDTSITWKDDNLWAQVGVMNTKTDIKKGLVVNIDDALSAYALSGFTLDDFTFYAGVKPKVINNSRIDLYIPNSVDSNGIMHYNTASNNYGTSTVPFVGASHTYYFRKEDEDTSLNTDVIADGNGNHSFNVTFEYKF
jgi:subtilisin family serine protease